MINREKVIRHIIAEISIAKTCKKDFASVDIDMLSDALALLKEQETEDTGNCRVFQCKKCGIGIDDIFLNDEEKYQIVPRYCPNCGRSVKWNADGT